MNKTLQKVSAAILSMCLLPVSIVPAVAADLQEIAVQEIESTAEVQTGDCGEDLTWELDSEGTLTISGTGAMYDFQTANYDSLPDSPWSEQAGDVKNIVLEEGITYIGKYSFYNMKGLTEVILPSTVAEIGKYAFRGCGNLEKVSFNDGLKLIDTRAFACCYKLQEIVLPKSVESVGEEAFYDCQNVKFVYAPNRDMELGTGSFLRKAGNHDRPIRAEYHVASGSELHALANFAETKVLLLDTPQFDNGLEPVINPGWYHNYIRWDSLGKAYRYNVYRASANSSKYTKIGSIMQMDNNTRIAFKDSRVENGKRYKYKVVVTNEILDREPQVISSKTGSKTYMEKGRMRKCRRTDKKNIYVQLRKNDKADGYQIQYCSSETVASWQSKRRAVFADKTVQIIPKTTITVKGSKNLERNIKIPNRNGKVYVRTRSYAVVNGVRNYGAWGWIELINMNKAG